MSDQSLVLATRENGLIEKLIGEWDKQLTAQKIPKEALSSVRTYEAQLQPDKVYGVFALCTPDGKGGGNGPFDAFVHLNHAFPKHPKPTLRLTWRRLAPRLERAPDPVAEHGRVFSGIVGNAIKLSQGVFKSTEIKVYLYNAADLAFACAFVAALTPLSLSVQASVRGNWLHFVWITR
jgi:hypothetical protein